MRKFIQLFKNKIKKLKSKMNFDEIIQRTSTYKSMYQGQEFQCMNAEPSHQAKIGKIFKIVDIEPDKFGNLFALLDDSSRINVDRLNRDFSLITEQTPALSIDQVRSIHDLPKAAEIKLTDVQRTAPIQSEQPKKVFDVLEGLKRETLPASPPPQTQIQAPISVTNSEVANIFGMFNSTEITLNLGIQILMPPISLLQVMYSQSVNKEDFLNKLAGFVQSKITIESIKDSLLTKLDKKKNRSKSDNEA